MGEKCSKCGHDINDLTGDCPGCGHRVREERLAGQLAIAKSALEGWQNKAECLKVENDNLRRFACDACRDGGPCDDCLCNDVPEAESA